MNKRALIIGIGDYSGAGMASLPHAAQDAKQVADLLSVEWHVTSTYSEDGAEPIKFEQVRALAEDHLGILDGENPDELDLLFYFTGHAARDKQTGVMCLQAWDGAALAFSALAELIYGCQAARSITLILDCCYSGDIRREFRQLGEIQSVVGLCACQSREQAQAVEGKGSRFTSLVVEGLQHPSFHGDVTASGLVAFIQSKWQWVKDHLDPTWKVPDPVMWQTSGPQTVLRRVDVVEEPGNAHARRGQPAVIVGPHEEIELRQEGRIVHLGWRYAYGAESNEWARFPVLPGERAVAVSRAEPSDAFVVLAGRAAARIVRRRQDGSAASADLAVSAEVIDADFGTGESTGMLTLHLRGGHAIERWVPQLRFAALEDPVG